ncbi:MAG: efflux RND transporter permease subunit [Aestuariivita sp.]|nr:efflux RND transporter permease subunit [Aestuariivita sp.]
MTKIVDWAAKRARMVLVFIIISIISGTAAYSFLPKEGEPEIDVPVIFISVPYNGISAEDSEKLLVRPMEIELAEIDGLTRLSGTAAEGYGGVVLEFEFGWDREATISNVREAMKTAESNFPEDAEKYSISTIDIFDLPIILVNSGGIPERTLRTLAQQLKERLERLESVDKILLVGDREEMLEVIINPLLLESYNLTASDLIRVVVNNNRAIAAGEVETDQGIFSLKIPSGYQNYQDIYNLPIKVEGDSVITLGELAEIRLTFKDRDGTARHNGIDSIGLYIFKRTGYSLIETARIANEEAQAVYQSWSDAVQQAVKIEASNQNLFIVSMIDQLEASVFTAIALVMIVVLAALGTRASLLVGFSVPTSFLLCFAFLAIADIPITNIILFGLILSVGMLVDGAVVIVENADRRIREGIGPMQAHVDAAKRMFWPIISSTATTLCAFLPMLFWPGISGQFMGMLPITLIFVLSASLIVALIYIPVMGGIAGRFNRVIDNSSSTLRRAIPYWSARMILLLISIYLTFIGAMQLLNPQYLPFIRILELNGTLRFFPGVVLFIIGSILTIITIGSIQISIKQSKIRSSQQRTAFGSVIQMIVSNPIMPIISIGAIISAIAGVFIYYSQNNLGVEFFVDSEPENAIIFIRSRGNLSLAEKDALIQQVEDKVVGMPGIDSVFATAGENALQRDAPEVAPPSDSIGQIRIELTPWDKRPRVSGDPIFFNLIDTESVVDMYYGKQILDNLKKRLDDIPGVQVEVALLSQGPPTGKPIFLRIRGNNKNHLVATTQRILDKIQNMEGLVEIEDSLPLPGIDWKLDVDVKKAGRFGADVAAVGGMIQLVTHGLLLDTMRVDSSDEEIEIRVRLPEQYRLLSTIDSLKVWSRDGQVPLSNFVTRTPIQKIPEIERFNEKPHFDIKANVALGIKKIIDSETDAILGYILNSDDLNPIYRSKLEEQKIKDRLANQTARLVTVNANERINFLTEWLDAQDFPLGIEWEWAGDREQQSESESFLIIAFSGALGLMFIILLAQFNSFYNSILVLLAVIMSTTGVLLGMIIMQQPFSTIMTGIGIVALAGIVVNNNIVLIDTYQEFTRYMPQIEAIIRTTEIRLRPVLMTSITTMAGLTPMMFGVSLDFFNGGYSVDAPAALLWKQLATAVIFGLGTATVLTLVFTPSMLAIRVWTVTYALGFAQLFAWLSMPQSSEFARDWALKRATRKISMPEIIWEPNEAKPRIFHTASQPIPIQTDDTNGSSIPSQPAE